MFILSKGKPKTFNPIMIKNKTGGYVRNRRQRNHEGIFEEIKKIVKVKEYGIDKNVWLIPNGYTNSKSFKGEESHPAIFPDEIARRHIITWTNEGDIVYDPFLGSSTTTRVSKQLNRKWIGSELHTPYFEVSKQIMYAEE
jgi:DNA modification methylase